MTRMCWRSLQIAAHTLLCFVLVGMSQTGSAQTVPTDLLDLSIEELFEANVVTEAERAEVARRWHLSYTYAVSDYHDYYLGTQRIGYDEVLFQPGQEDRTNSNYPVVPTEIKQEVHALRLAYDLTPAVTLRAQLPLVMQSTDHISIVPGYDAFNISSEGVGDIALVVDGIVSQSLSSIWKLGAGVSVPSGSIDEGGDTPRAPGNQQLPYTMQLGSGTWDIPLLLSFRKYGARWDWGANADVTWRTGKNDRDYRWRGTIAGQDETLLVPNPQFPYPAPVTNPSAFGGEQIDLTVFVRFPFADGWYAEASYAQPLYLDLNGPQSSEKYHFSIEIGTSF